MKKIISLFMLSSTLLLFLASCQSGARPADSTNVKTPLENIFARKSVRTYLDRTVEKDKIETMLRAGMAAPSGMDKRPWEFIVVTERARLDSMAANLPYAKMLAKTQQAIIVCGNPARSSYWYLDCSAATQNILLAAESLGLGAVWTAAYPYEDRMNVVRKFTGIPSNIHPLCVIPFGYPSGKHSPKDKYDEFKVHYDTFQR